VQPVPGFFADLRRRAEDFAQRAGFTYAVLARGSDRIIGCVYIYPWRGEESTADVQSWVRAERAHLDAALHDAVAAWLDNAWPFTAIRYAPGLPPRFARVLGRQVAADELVTSQRRNPAQRTGGGQRRRSAGEQDAFPHAHLLVVGHPDRADHRPDS
jgi:hypothetical protein